MEENIDSGYTVKLSQKPINFKFLQLQEDANQSGKKKENLIANGANGKK